MTLVLRLLLVSILYFLFPWLKYFQSKRISAGGLVFLVWALAYLMAVYVWFGVGVFLVVGLGCFAVFTSSVDINSALLSGERGSRIL